MEEKWVTEQSQHVAVVGSEEEEAAQAQRYRFRGGDQRNVTRFRKYTGPFIKMRLFTIFEVFEGHFMLSKVKLVNFLPSSHTVLFHFRSSNLTLLLLLRLQRNGEEEKEEGGHTKERAKFRRTKSGRPISIQQLCAEKPKVHLGSCVLLFPVEKRGAETFLFLGFRQKAD